MPCIFTPDYNYNSDSAMRKEPAFRPALCGKRCYPGYKAMSGQCMGAFYYRVWSRVHDLMYNKKESPAEILCAPGFKFGRASLLNCFGSYISNFHSNFDEFKKSSKTGGF
jgi:hypothetical protein